MTNTHCRKAYVSVNLDVDEEGVCHPRFIRWENGLIFQIDQILYKCRAASKKSWRRRYSLYCDDPWEGIVPLSGGNKMVCRSKGGSQMILSHKEIEEIAAAVTKDFNEFFFGPDTDGRRLPRGTPIDQFAREYLGLNVSFAYLSEDGSICGLTAYTDTEYIVEDRGFQRKIPLHRNEVLMNRNFIEPSQIRKLCGKRRFTLAHECAHQILFQMETDKIREACRRKYSARTAYSLRELKTREDWNEWQANVLGAAILMPQREIDLAVAYYARGRKLVSYDGTYAYWDKVALDMICQQFGVSKTAAVIRLRQLGHLETRPYSEYNDPLEVWA